MQDPAKVGLGRMPSIEPAIASLILTVVSDLAKALALAQELSVLQSSQ